MYELYNIFRDLAITFMSVNAILLIILSAIAGIAIYYIPIFI